MTLTPTTGAGGDAPGAGPRGAATGPDAALAHPPAAPPAQPAEAQRSWAEAQRSWAAARGRLARFDPRRAPGWVQALLALAASRALFTFVAYRCAVLGGHHQDGTAWTYLQIANNWDGTWYQRIAVEGYPHGLPLDSTGKVPQNAWAFYPLFPMTVRLVERVGLSWTAAATVVSLLATAVAVVLLRSLAARLAGPRAGLWTVAFLCFFPSALVLQLPYSEALAIMLLIAVFWCLQRGRYLTAVPLVLLIGLARPIAVPLAVVLAVHLAAEAWGMRGMPRSIAVRALAGPVLVCLAGGLAAVAWPLLVWWGTGVPDGYTRTMAAWRYPRPIEPVRPWIDTATLVLGGNVGRIALFGSLGALACWLVVQGRRVIGRDLAVWCAAYVAYLVAVLDSFSSLPRYLLPLFPLGTMLAATSRSRAFRVAVTLASAVLGVIWMLAIWRSHSWAP